MEIYNERLTAGKLVVEVSVRKDVNGRISGCWIHCTARKEGRLLWESSVANADKTRREYPNVEAALKEVRSIFSCPEDDFEFAEYPKTAISEALYYHSLL